MVLDLIDKIFRWYPGFGMVVGSEMELPYLFDDDDDDEEEEEEEFEDDW